MIRAFYRKLDLLRFHHGGRCHSNNIGLRPTGRNIQDRVHPTDDCIRDRIGRLIKKVPNWHPRDTQPTIIGRGEARIQNRHESGRSMADLNRPARRQHGGYQVATAATADDWDKVKPVASRANKTFLSGAVNVNQMGHTEGVGEAVVSRVKCPVPSLM